MLYLIVTSIFLFVLLIKPLRLLAAFLKLLHQSLSREQSSSVYSSTALWSYFTVSRQFPNTFSTAKYFEPKIIITPFWPYTYGRASPLPFFKIY